MNNNPFHELFVLELANNHWGSLQRAKAIVSEFAQVSKDAGVNVAIKLQIRDVSNFIHKDSDEIQSELNQANLTNLSKPLARYINKTKDTEMSWEQFKQLAYYIRKQNMKLMATAFDEASVDFCATS